MAKPSDKEEFVKLIDHLSEAAECSRKLAFLRGQQAWLAVDEMILLVRSRIIKIAEEAEKRIIQ